MSKMAVLTVVLCAFVVSPVALPSVASEAPSITIYTDKDRYVSGDTIEVSLSGDNPGDAMWVSVYVGLLTPDGSIYVLGPDGWSGLLQPWIPDIYLFSGLSLARTPLWWFDPPCSMPPIADYGQYNFAAVLTHPGTLDWVCAATLAPFTVEATGTDIYVDATLGDDANDGTQDRPFRTITKALEVANGTQATPVIVHVAAGMYSASSNGERFPLFMKSFVSLCGEGRDMTIVDAEGAAFHVIFCDGVTNLAIEGLRVSGGNADASAPPNYSGGGICCLDSSPAITNNTISGNSVYNFGAGIYCGHNSSPTITNNMIVGNSALGVYGSGGGIYCCEDSSPTISNNTISGNTVEACGAGICCWWGTSPLIEENSISDNRASFGGAGIYCEEKATPTITKNLITGNVTASVGVGNGAGVYCANSSSPIISENTIAENSSSYDGGGIFCFLDSSPVIAKNTIARNNALDWGGGISSYGTSLMIVGNAITDNMALAGGGICCESYCSPTVTGNTITGNSADDAGGILFYAVCSGNISNNTITDNSAANSAGGISCCGFCSPNISHNVIAQNISLFGGGIDCTSESSPTITDNVITGNAAGSAGGGIDCQSSCLPLVTNNTIVGNAAESGGGISSFENSSPTITDCILWGNDDDLYDCSATYCCIEDTDEGEGNIHADPMFVSGPLGDFYLDPKSPCVDAGSRSAEEAGLSDRTTQADGTPDTGIVDMGFHYPLP